MTNSTNQIDDNDISSLCHEAASAGDEEQAILCERALAGDSGLVAEVQVYWADGRSEARTILPAAHITVGNSAEPVLPGNEAIPLGKTMRIGQGRPRPYCCVRLHGDELPYMALVTEASGKTLLDGARKKR